MKYYDKWIKGLLYEYLLTLLIYMAKWYVFDLSFLIPDSKKKQGINFRKMKKLMKNLTKYF